MSVAAKRQRIKSTYLSVEEEDAVIETSELNGTSVNYVIRIAVRKLLGMPAPALVLPQPETRSAESDD